MKEAFKLLLVLTIFLIFNTDIYAVSNYKCEYILDGNCKVIFSGESKGRLSTSFSGCNGSSNLDTGSNVTGNSFNLSNGNVKCPTICSNVKETNNGYEGIVDIVNNCSDKKIDASSNSIINNENNNEENEEESESSNELPQYNLNDSQEESTESNENTNKKVDFNPSLDGNTINAGYEKCTDLLGNSLSSLIKALRMLLQLAGVIICIVKGMASFTGAISKRNADALNKAGGEFATITVLDKGLHCPMVTTSPTFT